MIYSKKNVILSFDYELFFGDRSGTIENTLIKPTYSILDAMDSCNMVGSFFVDYLMFKYLELNTDTRSAIDLLLLKNQIKDIIRRGHRIEFHLHPHWLDAKYNDDGTWNFSNFKHYKLSTLTDNEILSIFKEGVSYLNSLAREIDPEYKIVAFRAGGWAVQPFEMLKKSFIENNIIIDSSSSFGAYNLCKEQSYDFRVMPTNPSFKFKNDVCIKDDDGVFIEVPITSYHKNILMMIIDRILRSCHLFEKQTDGTHKRSSYYRRETLSIKEKLNKKRRIMMSFSETCPLTLFLLQLFVLKDNLICYIDHPKDFSKVTLIGIKLISKLSNKYTYKDILSNV